MRPSLARPALAGLALLAAALALAQPGTALRPQPAAARPAAAAAGATALLSLEPARTVISVGQEATLDLVLDTGEAMADGVSAYLRFDPALLEIAALEPQPALPQVLMAAYDNPAGSLSYEAGVLGGSVTGRVTLARLRLRSRAASLGAGTWLRFDSAWPATTDVLYRGESVLQGSHDAWVCIWPDGPYWLGWLPLVARP